MREYWIVISLDERMSPQTQFIRVDKVHRCARIPLKWEYLQWYRMFVSRRSQFVWTMVFRFTLAIEFCIPVSILHKCHMLLIIYRKHLAIFFIPLSFSFVYLSHINHIMNIAKNNKNNLHAQRSIYFIMIIVIRCRAELALFGYHLTPVK